MQNADQNKRQEIRKQSKKHADIASVYLQGLTEQIIEESDTQLDFEDDVYIQVKGQVQDTTDELVGAKQLEKEMKRSCIKYAN